MPGLQSDHKRRAMTLSATMFYRISPRDVVDTTINAGPVEPKGNTIQAGKSQVSGSSENWQFFLQSDRYFIRNFDRGTDVQLGLSEDNIKTPKLYPKSGDLSQQWNLTKVDNYWRLTNGLAPGVVMALGTGLTTPQVRNDVPDLNKDWQIMENPSYDSKKHQ